MQSFKHTGKYVVFDDHMTVLINHTWLIREEFLFQSTKADPSHSIKKPAV